MWTITYISSTVSGESRVEGDYTKTVQDFAICFKFSNQEKIAMNEEAEHHPAASEQWGP